MSLRYLTSFAWSPSLYPRRPVEVTWGGLFMVRWKLRQGDLRGALGCLATAHGVEQAGTGTTYSCLRLGPVVVVLGRTPEADRGASRLHRLWHGEYERQRDIAGARISKLTDRVRALERENASLRGERGWKGAGLA